MEQTNFADISNALKYFSMAAAGIFGVIGAVKETKDAHGALNRWGNCSLAGIVAGTLCSIGIQYVENRKADFDNRAAVRSAIEATERQGKTLETAIATLKTQQVTLNKVDDVRERVERSLDEQQGISQGMSRSLAEQQKSLSQSNVILSNVTTGLDQLGNVSFNLKRTMSPLTPVALNLTIRYSTRNPGFAAYANRLREDVMALIRAGTSSDRMVIIPGDGPDKPPKGVKINARYHLKYFPQEDKRDESGPVVAINQPIFSIFMNRRLDRRLNNRVESNLTYYVAAWNENRRRDSVRVEQEYNGAWMDMSLDVNFDEGYIDHTIFTTAIRLEMSRGTDLTSIRDLPGSSMEFRMRGRSPEVKLTSLTFRLGEGYSRWYQLAPEKFTEVAATDGLHYFYTFKPEDFELGE